MDVKRCYTLKDSLKLFDFDDDASILDLKRLLLRAAFSPAFLRCSDGRKFLPHVFTLDVRIQPGSHHYFHLNCIQQS